MDLAASLPRCAWAARDPLLCAYHDAEWGVPERDGRALWEKLVLDGCQAGLSWRIILAKREAFAGFEPARVAAFDGTDVARLLANAGIVRSRAKIGATVGNTRAYLAMAAAGEDFSTFVWTMAGGRPLQNAGGDVPTKTPLSETISAALRQRGFKFVGPVIIYVWMQSTGIVNDHTPDCFRRPPVA